MGAEVILHGLSYDEARIKGFKAISGNASSYIVPYITVIWQYLPIFKNHSIKI